MTDEATEQPSAPPATSAIVEPAADAQAGSAQPAPVQAAATAPEPADPTPGEEIAAAKTYAGAEKKSLLEKLHVLVADIENLPAETYAELKAFVEKYL